MTNTKLSTTDHLIFQLQTYTNKVVNGKLDIKDSKGSQWSIYYYHGQIIWATGGIHPYRRWLRNLSRNNLQINHDTIQVNLENTLIDAWEYHLLKSLYNQQKVNHKQVHSFVINTVDEVLFDLVQNLNKRSNQNINYEYNHFDFGSDVAEPPITSIDVNISLKQMQNSWNNWSELGLAAFSPNLAPILIQPEKLKQQVNPVVYKNLERLINGKNTLRDLAVKTQNNLPSIAISLLTYIYQGIAGFIEVKDMPYPCTQIKKNHNFTQPRITKNFLIACVDDSLQIGKDLEKVITSNGFRYIYINHPLEALSTLLQNQPDLIFLDLIMPIINGYELCKRLRRISILSNIPVVILTGSDGAFDQVKSKIYGATDFVKKPIDKSKVLEILTNYISPF